MWCAADPRMRSDVLWIDSRRQRATASDIRQTLADQTQVEQIPQHRLQTQAARGRNTTSPELIIGRHGVGLFHLTG